MDPLNNFSKELTQAIAEIRQLPISYQGRDFINLLSEGQLVEGSEIKNLAIRITGIVKNILQTTTPQTANSLLMVSCGLLGQSEIINTNSIVTLRIAWLASQSINGNSCTFEDFLKKTQLKPNEQLQVIQFIRLTNVCRSTQQVLVYPKTDLDHLILNVSSNWKAILLELFESQKFENKTIRISSDIHETHSIPIKVLHSLFADTRLNNPKFRNALCGSHAIQFNESGQLETKTFQGYYIYFASLSSNLLDQSFFHEQSSGATKTIPCTSSVFCDFFHRLMHNNFFDDYSKDAQPLNNDKLAKTTSLANFLDMQEVLESLAKSVKILLEQKKIPWSFLETNDFFVQYLSRSLLSYLPIGIQNKIGSADNIFTLKIAWLISKSLENAHSFENFLKKTDLTSEQQSMVLRFAKLIKICQSQERMLYYPKIDFDQLIKNTPLDPDLKWNNAFATILDAFLENVESPTRWIQMTDDTVSHTALSIPVNILSNLLLDKRLKNAQFCNRLCEFKALRFNIPGEDAPKTEVSTVTGYYIYFTSLYSTFIDKSFFDEQLGKNEAIIPCPFSTFYNFFREFVTDDYSSQYFENEGTLNNELQDQLVTVVYLADFLDTQDILNNYTNLVINLIKQEKIPLELLDEMPLGFTDPLIPLLSQWLQNKIQQLIITDNIDETKKLIEAANQISLSLDEISFSSCKFTTLNLQPLKDLVLERKITFNNCSIAQNIDLSNFFPNLKGLVLNNCSNFHFSSLNGLNQLINLQIVRQESANGENLCIDNLTSLRNLQIAELHRNVRIIINNPETLTSLRSISLANSAGVSSDFILKLTQLPSFENFELENCSFNINENGLPQTISACPKLSILTLKNLDLNTPILQLLHAVIGPKLSTLNLDNCKEFNNKCLVIISQNCKLLNNCTFYNCGDHITKHALVEFIRTQRSLTNLNLIGTSKRIFSSEQSLKSLAQDLNIERNIHVVTDAQPELPTSNWILFRLSVTFKIAFIR